MMWDLFKHTANFISTLTSELQIGERRFVPFPSDSASITPPPLPSLSPWTLH
jgi:hypothetical protein